MQVLLQRRPEVTGEVGVSVQEYDIADAGRVRGGCGMNRPDGLCWTDEIGAAVR